MIISYGLSSGKLRHKSLPPQIARHLEPLAEVRLQLYGVDVLSSDPLSCDHRGTGAACIIWRRQRDVQMIEGHLDRSHVYI
jgi:hypothetical protein